MKVDITIEYAGQTLTFKEVELDNHRLLQHETIYEGVVDDFYSNFNIIVVDTLIGKEL